MTQERRSVIDPEVEMVRTGQKDFREPNHSPFGKIRTRQAIMAMRGSQKALNSPSQVPRP